MTTTQSERHGHLDDEITDDLTRAQAGFATFGQLEDPDGVDADWGDDYADPIAGPGFDPMVFVLERLEYFTDKAKTLLCLGAVMADEDIKRWRGLIEALSEFIPPAATQVGI
jgi:hypothetical protein